MPDNECVKTPHLSYHSKICTRDNMTIIKSGLRTRGWHMKHKTLTIALFLLTAVFAVSGFSQVPATRLQTRLTGLTSPIFVTNAGDGTKRLFVVERAGIIKVVQPGSNVATEFLNITAKTTQDGERGLLGLAFHPDYATNRRFFVYYTQASDGAIHIGEYQASQGIRMLPTRPKNRSLRSRIRQITTTMAERSHSARTVIYMPAPATAEAATTRPGTHRISTSFWARSCGSTLTSRSDSRRRI